MQGFNTLPSETVNDGPATLIAEGETDHALALQRDPENAGDAGNKEPDLNTEDILLGRDTDDRAGLSQPLNAQMDKDAAEETTLQSLVRDELDHLLEEIEATSERADAHTPDEASERDASDPGQAIETMAHETPAEPDKAPMAQTPTEDSAAQTLADKAPGSTQADLQKPGDEADAPAASTLEEKIAALENVVARRSDQWDEDDPGTDLHGTFVHRPMMEDGASRHAPQKGEARQASSPEPRPSLLGDGIEIDEDLLREMVAEIVRQELQGALGERITRNVRKLVRREIHRVLISQDFD
ncbi:hypothetical protein [Cognatishimia sp. F0-27]|uniref:hypothetical protein n=1 Tax=Cognatishimia sp. F0-27 TaxID=2816855 RepID=UPI001D0C36AC|nr:hypothetical protein [Cognatishimia sp. F0-27]MCC1494669.1 hypothetical protein [Cognatishimia sp. F0-27]